MTRIGIIGGGITGLTVSHYLRDTDVTTVLFEANDQPGGVIHSTQSGERVLDHGPQRLRLTGPVKQLITDLELMGDLLIADPDLPLYIFKDQTLKQVPLTFPGFISTDLLSWRAKLRILGEPLAGPPKSGETVAELFTRKFGAEAYDSLIRPLFGGMYGSNPARMPAYYALQPLMDHEPAHGGLLRLLLTHLHKKNRVPPVSFENGLQTLPNALFERNQDQIKLNTPVIKIQSAKTGHEIVTNDSTTRVDHVVVTIPAPEAGELLRSISSGSATALKSLSYNPLAVVHLRASNDRVGLGYQTHPTSGLETLGVSWNASMFDRDGVSTCFLGGMDNPTVVDRDEQDIGNIAATEFETVMGTPATVLNVTILNHGFPSYDQSWMALDRVSFPETIHFATNYTGRMGIPSRIQEAKMLAATLKN